MTSQGNGQRIPYQVRLSGQVKQTIVDLHQQAIQKGNGQAFLDTLRAIHERLRHDPEQFGDPHFHLPVLNLLVYQAAISGVIVDYAIHQERPLVFLRGVKILS